METTKTTNATNSLLIAFDDRKEFMFIRSAFFSPCLRVSAVKIVSEANNLKSRLQVMW